MKRRKFLGSVAAGAFTTRAAEREIKLANGGIELAFDAASGALAWIKTRRSARIHRIGPAAGAPVRLWLGTPDDPDQAVITIARSSPQVFESQLKKAGADISLVLTCGDLKHDGKTTGVALTQTFTVSPGDDFVRIRTSIDNRGPRWITGLFLGLDGLSLNADAKVERLSAGGRNAGPTVDPRHNLPAIHASSYSQQPAGKRAFSVPPTAGQSLLACWLDYSDPAGGIGTGYLDHAEMDLVGDVQASADGLSLGWRLFRLEDSRGFMWPINGKRQIYPLAPGEQFVSDEWFLMCHDGDWHRTADAYRSRYEVVFRGDYLDWPGTSSVVRDCDLIINNYIAWGKEVKEPGRYYDYPHGYVIHKFDAIAPLMKKTMAMLDVNPPNVLVTTLGTAPEWGVYKMPDLFPMIAEAGGQEAADRMARDLLNAGVAGIIGYAHPYFLHRKAKNYLPSADTSWNYPHQDWHTSMGGIACMADEEWQKLWERDLFPKFIGMGVRGLYWDEGFGHAFICTHANHAHGGSALSVLTAQSRAATRLYKTFRKLAGPRGFLTCQGGSDVQARYIDLWHAPPNDYTRFTHPDKPAMARLLANRKPANVGDAFLLGCPIIFMPYPGPQQKGDSLEGELLEALRQFVRLRRELREKKAPGYPDRFRDTIGVTISGGNLRAKAYAGKAGVTVVYFAQSPFAGTLSIDGAALGLTQLGKVQRKLKLAAKQMGYEIFSLA